jgi:Ca2+-binding EF-hand superfamily protein
MIEPLKPNAGRFLITSFQPHSQGTNMKIMKIVFAAFAVLASSISVAAQAAPDAMAVHDKHFAAMDKNGDGQISREEAAAFPRLSRHFDKIDTNRDGNLSKDELKVAAQKGRDHRFALIDTNKDGLISRSEAAAWPRLAARFDQLDSNKDGYLSREELAAARHEAHR